MTTRNQFQTTVIACAAIALGGVLAAIAMGRPTAGFAFAAGLGAGSVNVLLVRRATRSALPFQATSLARLGVLTVAGAAAGLAIDGEPFWPLAGLAAAQVVMAATAAVSLVRR